MDLMAMYNSMGIVAKCVAVVLIIMSMWSIGVGIERFFTYQQARNQSRLYAPQVAKHIKEGRLKDALALSTSKNYRYSHLAKVVLAGLQEYQFQKESGGGLQREDLLDTVRRSIQRASALTASDLKKGVSALATIGSTAAARRAGIQQAAQTAAARRPRSTTSSPAAARRLSCCRRSPSAGSTGAGASSSSRSFRTRC